MLPIANRRDELINLVSDNQVTIVVGETGSGKTTAIPQYLYEAEFGQAGMIGVTEPRRIAATSVAAYVAMNLNVTVGKTVAHKIRFDDVTSDDTVVKFMTDGILLREFHEDPMLSKYSVIMVDEAHERSANIDFLLGLLKQVLARRPELRIVVASATIDAEKFSNYFGGAPILKVDGRLHHVETIWAERTMYDVGDMIPSIVETIQAIFTDTVSGDILVFLTGIDDIDAVEEALGYLRGSHNFVVLPAHGSLSSEDQANVFRAYPGKRKVVLATNIAETSITIDGIVYVIDTGLIKQTNFSAQSGIQSLDVVEHSQAGCEQRTGRAGRTQPGVCYRLFTKESYEGRPAFTAPEITRMSLAGVVLAMEALEIPNIKTFDFIDAPNAEAFKEAYETLEALGAIEKDGIGLTAIGEEMAALPLEPRTSRMVIEARKHGCVENVATIAAFMSAGRNVFARPRGKERDADAAHSRFKHHESDMLTFLRIWKEYGDSDFSKSWCFKHFLSDKTLNEIKSIRAQLLKQLSRSGVEVTESSDNEAILRCVAAGLAYNLLRHSGRFEYDGVERMIHGAYIHPGSALFGYSNHEWLVTAEIVDTTKRFARNCSVVKPSWLVDISPTKFRLGEVKLTSYTDGEDHVNATREILYKTRYDTEAVVGKHQSKISLDDARRIQELNIRDARREGLLLLTIEDRDANISFSSKLGRSNDGQTYTILTYLEGDLKVGSQFFCRLNSELGWSNYVRPVFPVLDLPRTSSSSQKEKESKQDVLSGITLRETDGSLGAQLAAAVQRKAGKR